MSQMRDTGRGSDNRSASRPRPGTAPDRPAPWRTEWQTSSTGGHRPRRCELATKPTTTSSTPEPLRKVLADEQIGAGANQAAPAAARRARRRRTGGFPGWQCGQATAVGDPRRRSRATAAGFLALGDSGRRHIHISSIIRDTADSADSSSDGQFAEEVPITTATYRMPVALCVLGIFSVCHVIHASDQRADDARRPAQRRASSQLTASGGSPAANRKRQPDAAHDGAHQHRRRPSARTSRRSGASSIVGVLRYQWPSNIAAIVEPSTRPPVTGSSQREHGRSMSTAASRPDIGEPSAPASDSAGHQPQRHESGPRLFVQPATEPK